MEVEGEDGERGRYKYGRSAKIKGKEKSAKNGAKWKNT
jgi:hypothetical protein